jgi:hypothetical protein
MLNTNKIVSFQTTDCAACGLSMVTLAVPNQGGVRSVALHELYGKF